MDKNGIYVVNYHGTPQSVSHLFKKHLKYYKKNFHILGPAEFEEMCKNKIIADHSRPKLLLTFDDGMQNNHHAIKFLNQEGIKAFFFIIPAFIEAKNPENYLSTVIRPGYINKKENQAEDFMPMDWSTIIDALKDGHKVGSHTYSHTLLKENGEEKSFHEIVESRKHIEECLAVEIPYFCSINNTDVSVGDLQRGMINSHYQYHFTTYFGDNFPELDPLRIERINIEAYWGMNELRFALGGIRKRLIKK